MPPHRKVRTIVIRTLRQLLFGATSLNTRHPQPRRFLPTAAFYDKAGAIGSPLPSPTGSSFGDDAYTLTGYGELSSESAFMLPPSPTQTIKYRYRAYRPKLARLRKQRSSASKSSLKTKSSAYHPSVRPPFLFLVPSRRG